ncbi:MAG: hypothetical protein ACRD11_07240 [Terriglobia bacterium]
MKKQISAVICAVLVVLASTGLRKAFAKAEHAAGLWNNSSTLQRALVIPGMVPMGSSPAPALPNRTVAAIGSSPMPVPKYRTLAAIGMA